MRTKEEIKSYQHAHYLANKEKYNNQARIWRLKNLDRHREYHRDYERDNRSKMGHPQEIRQDYGITIDQYNEMFSKQNGCCGICGKHQSNEEMGRRLAVDHCHTTKKVRGLLCRKCNTALGLFRDNPELIQKALSYLNG